jgi:hypothetical protein
MSSRTDRLIVAAVGGVIGGAAALAWQYSRRIKRSVVAEWIMPPGVKLACMHSPSSWNE